MIGLRKAVLLATVEQQLALGANFIIAVLTSRLMAPREIGITVVGAAVVALVTALREYATATYLIKHADLSRRDMNGALTAMLCFNVLLTGSLALSAPLFGALYSDDRLVSYLRVVALGLMVEAFASPVVAVARREMAIDKAATIGVVGTAIMTTSTVAMAAYGLGYMSFAWGVLCGTSAMSLTAAFIRPKFWLFRPTFKGWRSLFIFGGYNGTNSLLRQCYDSVPYLVLGHILPFEQVAYFHRALMLSQLPAKLLLGGVEVLMLPALATQIRQNKNLKAPFLRTLQLITVVYWPALILLAILAEPLVKVFYGQSWLAAAPLVQIMSLAALFAFIGKLDASVLVAAGGLRDMLKRSLVAYPVCAAISSGSAFFGVFAVAFSYWLTYPLQLYVSLHFIRRHIPFTWRELFTPLSESALVAIASMIGPLAVILNAGMRSLNLADAFVAIILAMAGWALALWYMRHPLFAEIKRPQDLNPQSEGV